MQKAESNASRTEKVLKRKVAKYLLNGKVMIGLLMTE